MRPHTTLIAGIALAFSLVIALGAVAYVATLSFSESTSMTPGSFAARVLVPDELEVSNLQEIGSVTGYRYSAADGPKPTIVIATLATAFPRSEIDVRIGAHFERAGFKLSGERTVSRANEELTWSYLPDPTGARLEIALLTYMR